MKFLPLYASTALITLLLISTARAAEIRMGFHEYDFGKAACGADDRDVFVICESCPARRQLSLKPRATNLAVRMTEEQLVKTASDKPEKRLARETSGECTSVAETVRSTSVVHNCLQPVYFRFDRSDLSDREKDQLDRLISCLKADSPKKSSKIRITGHTCDMGGTVYNNRLSLMRAKSVAAYMGENGFDVSEFRGEGMSRPLSRIRSLNRRVEIKIVP